MQCSRLRKERSRFENPAAILWVLTPRSLWFGHSVGRLLSHCAHLLRNQTQVDRFKVGLSPPWGDRNNFCKPFQINHFHVFFRMRRGRVCTDLRIGTIPAFKDPSVGNNATVSQDWPVGPLTHCRSGGIAPGHPASHLGDGTSEVPFFLGVPSSPVSSAASCQAVFPADSPPPLVWPFGPVMDESPKRI